MDGARAAPSWDDAAPAVERPTCRFCFEEAADDDELVAPCACSGSQKYVHATCLRRWQAHQRLEAASSRADVRAKANTCDVCHTEFSTPAPTDAELLAVVRPNDGAAIASVLGQGVLLGSTKTTRPDTSGMPGPLAMLLLRRAAHWRAHVFLLYASEAGGAADGGDQLHGCSLTREVRVDGKHKVVGASAAELLYGDALQELVACSKDVQTRIAAARKAGVAVRIVLGGPCHPKQIVALHAEADVEGSRAATPSGDVRYGGAAEAVLGAAEARARAGAANVAVLLAFGHARWGRTQLQNEVLRGDWGVNASLASASLVLRPGALTHEATMAHEGTRRIQPPE